jgi:hypothetical protein
MLHANIFVSPFGVGGLVELQLGVRELDPSFSNIPVVVTARTKLFPDANRVSTLNGAIGRRESSEKEAAPACTAPPLKTISSGRTCELLISDVLEHLFNIDLTPNAVDPLLLTTH